MEFKAIKPPLSKVAFTPLFTYWVIRVKMPLRFIDDRYISPGDHCARIFPKRGVVLLTEDMLDDLKGTAITLQWFRTRAKEIAKSTRQSTPWHLMLPPKIIEWLETRLDDENYSEQHGL
jgi:chromo domain-containing protein 1